MFMYRRMYRLLVTSIVVSSLFALAPPRTLEAAPQLAPRQLAPRGPAIMAPHGPLRSLRR